MDRQSVQETKKRLYGTQNMMLCSKNASFPQVNAEQIASGALRCLQPSSEEKAFAMRILVVEDETALRDSLKDSKSRNCRE